MFESTKKDLKDILRDAHEGKWQLPDFQRDYVWGDEDVRSLIASVAKGFPVGALLTLATGGAVEFKPRLIAGVPATTRAPEELLLDGQQRITSLYQVMYSNDPVATLTERKEKIERHYYLDINAAVTGGADILDAIVGVPADRKIRTNFGRDIVLDLSTREQEFDKDHFPLGRVFDSRNWLYDWRQHWRERGRDVSDLDQTFYRQVLEPIERYKMPIIQLDRDNSREAICLVFEKVNVGGKKLDAFELVTAIYAGQRFDLREDWGIGDLAKNGRRQRIVGSPRRDVLSGIASTDFLQACTLLHTREHRLNKAAEGATGKELPQVSCSRGALLALPLEAYQKFADPLEEGFVTAGAFLNELKIIWRNDVPYPPQLVALAAVFATLGRRAETAAAKQKISQWFWCITLGEQYGSATESKLGRDVPELVAWIADCASPPRSIDVALFQRNRLRSLRLRLSAAYKGIHALLMKSGCRDFISGRPVDIMTFFRDKIDIHHVFPQKWCKDRGIPPAVFNSIVNKSPLSKRSNILIGGDAPSVYLKRIETKEGIGADDLDGILRSHLIDVSHLRADDFDGFFEARLAALSGLVEEAMGKPVVGTEGSNEPQVDIGLVEDDELEEEAV